MKKHLLVLMAALVFCYPSSNVAADSCEPDDSQQDKISKQQIEVWKQVLTSSGILSAALMDDDFSISASVGRYGSINAINIIISKKEQKLARAAFESQYHAVKGDQFVFGFKNSAPLSFVATEVSNQSKAGSIVENLSAPVLVTTVILSAHVPDKDLATLRDALTSTQIDAVRIALSSGQVETAVEDKNSKKLMAKFKCFFEAMDKRGISGAADQTASAQAPVTNDPARMAAVRGRYARKEKPTDFIELNADGTSGLRQDGHSVLGHYAVQGDTISFTSPEMPGLTSKGHLTGDTIKDDEGIIWEKMTEAQRAAAPPLSMEPEPSQSAVTSALGRYVLKGGSWYIELKADGTVSCQLSATKPCSGTYKLAGPGVALQLNVGSINMKIVGNTLVGKTQVWEKQVDAPRVEAPKAATTTVTLRLGMTPQEVEAAQGGKPQKVIDLGSKKTFVYPDMKIIFVDGKVTDIQ